MSHKSVDRRVQVKDIPEKEAVLPTELGDHHCHQPIAERLERETPFQLASGSYAPMLLLSCLKHMGFKGAEHKTELGLKTGMG